MDSKYLASLLIAFGLLFAFAQCERFAGRDADDSDADDGDSGENDLQDEKRAIADFLQNEDDASQFLDHSRRMFSSQKSHMKEAKKKYEEKCERLLHPRYCPDLATWPAWNQAFAAATSKK